MAYPGKAWKTAAYRFLHGASHPKTITAAEEILHDNIHKKCCQDPGLTRKLCAFASCAQDLITGPPGEAMFRAAANSEVLEVNTDLESDQARHRQMNQCKGSVSIERLAESSFLERWCSEHRRRGGVLDTGLHMALLQPRPAI